MAKFVKNNSGVVRINFIIDESGSMLGQKTNVINGFNEFVQEQKKQPGKTFLTLTKFNSSAGVVYSGVDINEVPELNVFTYTPGGMTALNDAIGNTILAEDKFAKGCKVLFVVMTDGQENASRKFKSANQIKSMIKEKEAEGNWTFVFMGADMDAQRESEQYGIGTANTMSYNSAETFSTMKQMSDATIRYRSSADGQTMDFFNKD